MRVDVYLVENNLFPSREKAKLAITEGKVLVNNKTIGKAGFAITETDRIEVIENQILKYVSLGGFKLEKAIVEFPYDFKGKKVLDIGASTGGFVDCALQFGAEKVVAVDVGSGQLNEKFKNNPKVQSFESQNIKDFQIDEKVDVILMDVSFTSQIPLLPLLNNFLNEKGAFISLIKPQFELDQRLRFPNGIVTDKKLQLRVLQNTITEATQNGLFIQKIIKAPIQPKKNVEYLALFYNYPPVKELDLKAIL